MIKLKKPIKDTAVFVCFLAAGVMLIVLRMSISQGVKNGIELCGEILIPSLFPFLVFSSLASQTAFADRTGNISAFITERVFRLPRNCFSVMLFGFIGGYPVGAKLSGDMYEKRTLAEKDCTHIMSFCVNAGPSFIVTAAGERLLGSRKAGFVLLAAVCLASIITGIVTGLFKEKPIKVKTSVAEKKDFSDALIHSVSSATESIFSICAWVILFSAVLSVTETLNFGKTLSLLIFSLTEVTTGIESAAKFGGLPFVAACISFGGLSILFQLLPTIKKCGVKVKTYLFFRIVNSVISFLFTKLILCFVDISSEVFSYPVKLFSSNAPASAALLIMCALFVYQLKGWSGESSEITRMFSR